jgi:uncharacterized protein YndB with AHSA1/START domain
MTEWTHTHTFTLPAPADRVFAALTEPAELQQWFAEQVEVDARAGGVFRAWGRHTYGSPGRPAGGGRITAFEPGRTLAFEWTFDGVPSEVRWQVDPDGKDAAGTSALTLLHAFARRSGAPYEEELVDDLWRLTLGNLDAHLRGGSGIVRPDYTDPNPEVRLSIVIDAPKDKVFRALIEPAALARWVGSQGGRPPVVEPRVGGRFEFGWEYEIKGRKVIGGPTRILDLVENERVVTDWLDWRGDSTRPPTRLAWLLESAGSGTRVTLVHGGFERTVDISDYPFGWGYFLGQLKTEAER